MHTYKRTVNLEVIGYLDADFRDVQTLKSQHRVMSSHSQMESYHGKTLNKESLHPPRCKLNL
jgi:hypothetical protein